MIPSVQRSVLPIWLFLPCAVAIAGFIWIDRATTHFEALTDRAFYSLAGYHYSVPEWGFAYHPGGEKIHRWTTIVPGYTTTAALLLCGVLAIARNRSRGWPTVLALFAVYVIITVGFLLVAAFYDMNITGVFI
jgi:hypothetical protein